jgi:surface antigen
MRATPLLLALLLALGTTPAFADRDEHGDKYDKHDKRHESRDREERREAYREGYQEGRRDERRDERHDRGLHRGHNKPGNPHYRGYSGRDWDNDYGIRRGRCDSEAAGAAVGAVIGGVIGHQVGKDSADPRVATIAGVAIGAILGAKVARDIDRRDAACIGHSLELARDGERVVWERDRQRYEVRPIRRFQEGKTVCRTYELITPHRTERQTACQTRPGYWETR